MLFHARQIFSSPSMNTECQIYYRKAIYYRSLAIEKTTQSFSHCCLNGCLRIVDIGPTLKQSTEPD